VGSPLYFFPSIQQIIDCREIEELYHSRREFSLQTEISWSWLTIDYFLLANE
jgi:hypothetical protein